MYLPNHVVLIYKRIWYYVHGEFANITGVASEAIKTARVQETVTGRVVVETANTVMRKLDEL